MNQIVDVFYLHEEREGKISDPYIRGFSDYGQLKDFAKSVEDSEITRVCKVVEEYGGRIPGLVKDIGKAAVNVNKADILLSTVHKAKGPEWANVHITSDFPDLIEDGEFVDTLDPDEFNLIYVSVTRSICGLRFDNDSSIKRFILQAKRLV